MNQKNIELIYTINHYTTALMKIWSDEFPHRISISALLVLGELRDKGPQKQIDMAHFLNVTPGAMTNIATIIVRENYAERIYDKNDRRITRLAITAAGEIALKEASELDTRVNTDVLGELTEAEKVQFLELFNKLNRKIHL